MNELLAPGGVAHADVVTAETSMAPITTSSYLSYHSAIGRMGYPTAIASNPILEADDSSPWWQSRMVCRPVANPGRVPGPDPVPEEIHGGVFSYLHGEAEAEVALGGFEAMVYVDLGSGAVTALPIGNLVPVTRDWSWSTPEQLAVEDLGLRHAGRETTEVTKLPAAEPEWNEADDELPTWVELDCSEWSSGALMSRRRPSATGE
jgi:hypothetical protein